MMVVISEDTHSNFIPNVYELTRYASNREVVVAGKGGKVHFNSPRHPPMPQDMDHIHV